MPTAEQLGARFLREGVATRVRRLRDLADRIEREAERNIARAEDGRGTYGCATSNIVHELMWGLANLNVDSLLSTATDADIAHAEGKSK
jgi:predicted kinase